MVAEALNLSRAELYGTVTFYHDFRNEPPGRRVLKLCRAESCQAMGCEDLVEHLRERHGLTPDSDGEAGLRVETVYCLGNCALSPAALLDGAPIGRLDRGKIDAIVAGAEGKAS
jgi:formate dehydrogenase subunit gamma